MKAIKVVVIIFLLLPVISKAEQHRIKEKNVSVNVINSFTEKWPDINVKKWEKKDDTFIAVFLQGDKKLKSSFDVNGNWLQTKTRIKWKELPSLVRKTYYGSDFTWQNWNWVEKLQTSEYKEVYLIEGDNSNTESDPLCYFKLWITPDGKMVKTESDN